MPMTDDQFLALVPVLARIPDEWEDQQFWMVHTIHGELCVLAYDEDEAERATLVYFGRVSQPSLMRGEDDRSITRRHPSWTMVPCQYLDSTRVLHGDPCDPAMRAPDSSPALSVGMSFAIDACGADRRLDSLRSPLLAEQVEQAADRRDRYLRRAGLLREIGESVE